jgi:ribonuclease-3
MALDEEVASAGAAHAMTDDATPAIHFPDGYFEHLNTLEEIIGYKFHDKSLLAAALDRRSDMEKGLKEANPHRDIEHLECLGDSVLNLSIKTKLSLLHPTWKPSELTRAYIRYTRNADESAVHGGPLYRIAKEINLSHYILFAIGETLDDSYAGCKNKKGLPRENKLCDHMEAIFGALFLDCGINHSLVSEVIWRMYAPLGILKEDHESDHDFGQSVVSPEGSSLISETIGAQQRFIELAGKGNHIELNKVDRDGLDIDTIERGFWAAASYSRSNVVAIIVREFPISNEVIEAVLKEPLLDISIRGFLNNHLKKQKPKIEEFDTPPEDLSVPLDIFSSQPSEPEIDPEKYFLELVIAGNDTQLANDNIEISPELAAKGFMLSIAHKKPNVTPYLVKRYGIDSETMRNALKDFPDMCEPTKYYLLRLLRTVPISPSTSLSSSTSFAVSSVTSTSSGAGAMPTLSPESIGGFGYE